MSAESARYAEAIAAFDAGNLAWGHFRHEVLPACPAAASDAVDSIRDALGDAAIAIVDLEAGDPPDEFRSMVRNTLDLLSAYRAALPDDVPRDDLDSACDLLSEALAALDAV